MQHSVLLQSSSKEEEAGGQSQSQIHKSNVNCFSPLSSYSSYSFGSGTGAHAGRTRSSSIASSTSTGSASAEKERELAKAIQAQQQALENGNEKGNGGDKALPSTPGPTSATTSTSSDIKDKLKSENEKDDYPFSLFTGSLQNSIECQTCGRCSRKEDPIEDLELDIGTCIYYIYI